MPRRVLPVLAALLGSVAVAAPAQAALKTRACKGTVVFRCATLPVPLDRSGAVPGTVNLAVAIERARSGADGYLVALSGGPGQPSVPYADSFRSSLTPALRHRRLVLLDQRGTGASGALSCAPLQKLGSLDVVNTRVVENCARKLGPARQFYSTTDTVLDVEAVRAAIGAPKLQLMGISYGTYVAAQYARRFPERTEGLILDSIVPPDGIDGYFLDTFGRLPRVVAEQCARGRCRGATTDAVGDLRKLTAKLAAGPLRGTVRGSDGKARTTSLHDESELLLTIMSGDLNPFLQAALPGAIDAAVHGDSAPLLRLRRLANGPFTPTKEFSSTLNVATTCADVALPYTLDTPIGQRWELWRHGIDALPDTAFAPFSRPAVIDTSVAHDCVRWPQGDHPAGPSHAPLPDVPALILSGRLDTRTPVENAREFLPLLPHAQLLTVPGTGHDILDSDITGCAARALKRFADGLKIGTPCAGRTNAVSVLARPARSVSAYRSAPGVGGTRGRVLFATLDTLAEAQIAALQTLYAGFSPLRGGGLRGGSFAASGNGEDLELHGYEHVPGVALSGSVRAEGSHSLGTITVNGPGRMDGKLRLDGRGDVRGTIGGKAVHFRDVSTSSSGMAARAGARRVPARLRLPSLAAARRHVAALRRVAG